MGDKEGVRLNTVKCNVWAKDLKVGGGLKPVVFQLADRARLFLEPGERGQESSLGRPLSDPAALGTCNRRRDPR